MEINKSARLEPYWNLRRLITITALAFALYSSRAAAQTCGTTWAPGTGKLTTGCNVGVGTSNPSTTFEIISPLTAQPFRSTRLTNLLGPGPQSALSLVHQTTGGQMIDGFGVSVLFYARDVDGVDNIVGKIGAVRDLGNDGTGKMTFAVGNAGTPTDRLIISNTGVQAIGVPLTANYADLAEWVTVKGTSDPGTVVVIHGGGANEVEPARKAYDTSVAGVVSAKPGIVLGEAGDGKAMIATTGRVKVKVHASSGPIHIGDLLVTSDREGYAMKSEPVDVAGVRLHRPGTLIGKALEPIESGDGEILVLLSLQ